MTYTHEYKGPKPWIPGDWKDLSWKQIVIGVAIIGVLVTVLHFIP